MPKSNNIPLRLRRRRDGSLCLTDANGALGGEFPSTHFFLHEVLAKTGAKMEGDEITLNLANASATYKVTSEDDPRGVWGELTKSNVKVGRDVPPVDEKAAAKLAAKEG